MSPAPRFAALAGVAILIGALAFDGLRAIVGESIASRDAGRAPVVPGPAAAGARDESRDRSERAVASDASVAAPSGASAEDASAPSKGGLGAAADPALAGAGLDESAGADSEPDAGVDPDAAPGLDPDVDPDLDPDAIEHDGESDLEVAIAEPGAPAPPGDGRFDVFPGKRLAKGPWVVPRSALAERLRASLADKRLAGAKVAVTVIAAEDGATLFAKDADESLIVASNNKLVTTAAALRVLGPEFVFRTRLCASGALASGSIAGDLIVVGDGDPDVLPKTPSEKSSLAGRIAAALLAAGVKRVSGDLVIDDLVFDRQYLPPQWRKDQLAHDYAAPTAGFSLYENCLVVLVKPAPKVGALASVDLLPRTGVLAPEVGLKTGAAKTKNSIFVPSPVAPGKVKVSGKTPHGSSPVPLFLPLSNPGATHPGALKDALERAGIEIGGAARLAAARTDLQKVRVLATIETPFSTVLRKLNKESSNVLAEHVYKRIGFAAYGSGTYGNAGKAVLETLRHHGIDAAGAASADGSGLSRGNTFTARQMALLLRAMWKDPARALVVDSLPVSGVDGTLSKRLTQDAYKGRIRAKTGYIAGVSTLSGYAASASGEVFCFSVLVNGVKGATAAKAVQDAIAKLLADVGPKAP